MGKKPKYELHRIKSGRLGCWIEVITYDFGVPEVIELWASWQEMPMVEMNYDFSAEMRRITAWEKEHAQAALEL